MRCDIHSHDPPRRPPPTFQSLLGFLMRCDVYVGGDYMALEVVSIPAGFSDALRQCTYRGKDL